MSDKKLLIKLAADVEGLKKGLRQASQQVDTFTSEIQKVGGVMAAAFSVKAIGSFVLEISKLSGEAEGVREAFERLPNSVKVMTELKAATHGTVSELDLMKRAVMASNFDISLKALPRLLEFATIRAKQTGQSIDYLVDSIVTGIGRKSKLILDNLGISAVQLTEALGGASTASSSIGQVAEAVGKIAEENLKKMGTLSENASTKMERLNASWINLKVALGDVANGTGILGGVIDSFNNRIDILTGNLPVYIKLLALMGDESTVSKVKMMEMADAAKRLAEDQKLSASITRQAQQAIKTFGTNLDAISKAYQQNINYQKIINEVNRLLIEDAKKQDSSIRNEANLTAELNSLKEDAIMATASERLAINQKVQAIEKEIEALQKLGIEKKKVELGSGPAAPAAFHHYKGASTINELGSGPMLDPDSKKTWMGEGPMFNDDEYQKTQERMEGMARGAARAGDAIGAAFGSMVNKSKSFSQAMAEMAVSVIDAIERVVLAQMIANSAKYGLAGIALAAAGFAIVKALFNRIGGSGTSGSSSPTANTMATNSYSSSGGMYLMASVSGRQLNLILTEQSRYDARTKTTP